MARVVPDTEDPSELSATAVNQTRPGWVEIQRSLDDYRNLSNHLPMTGQETGHLLIEGTNFGLLFSRYVTTG